MKIQENQLLIINLKPIMMKTKEKPSQSSTETQESKKFLSVERNEPSSNLNGGDEHLHNEKTAFEELQPDENQEQLIERLEVENTPFIIIKINNEYFGTFGKYRVTEVYQTAEQCRAALTEMNWNNIIKHCALLFDMINQKNN